MKKNIALSLIDIFWVIFSILFFFSFAETELFTWYIYLTYITIIVIFIFNINGVINLIKKKTSNNRILFVVTHVLNISFVVFTFFLIRSILQAF